MAVKIGSRVGGYAVRAESRPGNDTVVGQYDGDTAISCTGNFVVDPETGVVSFVPDDGDEFDAVVAADKA